MRPAWGRQVGGPASGPARIRVGLPKRRRTIAASCRRGRPLGARNQPSSLCEVSSSPLIIVSNRGPLQFEREHDRERTVRRGGGGLVTALSGLVSHRDALWIASAMTDEDVAVSEERGGPVELSIDGIDYRVLLVGSDAEAYDRFYNVIANPILWFIQHYLWDLSNAPDIRREEADAWDYGYKAVNADIARSVLVAIENETDPLVMFHDYHLYTCPALVRSA